MLTGLRAQPGTIGQLAAAAGLAFHAYQLSYGAESRAERYARLFPRRLGVVRAVRRRLGRR
ncbi:uncharacterized membrane protein YebE (DUF533 family) [Streptacidiphilus sp. MAP12-33]|uniref:hypothetical protein n=1 Tax=Streptacidiphilus sp. MAP12-33 TaxID=3156266 RepID=UPI003515113D